MTMTLQKTFKVGPLIDFNTCRKNPGLQKNMINCCDEKHEICQEKSTYIEKNKRIFVREIL